MYRLHHMNEDLAKKVCSEAKLLRFREVVFSGGEPLLWDSLLPSVGHCSSLKFQQQHSILLVLLKVML